MPILMLTAHSPLDLVQDVAILVGGLAVLLLSLTRLRRQMIAAKKRFISFARGLYAEAYAPLRAEGSLAVLRARTPELNAAEALLRRAEAIQEWPFEEAVLGRVAVVITSVLAAVIARLLISGLGL